MISIKEIMLARDKMKGIVYETPLDRSHTFSELSGNDVYLKLENLQKTGSFKVRGSYNKIMNLDKGELQKGVVAASAGNHAQGVAYSSKILGIPCTIVMPNGAPLSKVLATKGYGANVELYGDVFDDSLSYALELRKQTGASFVHAFDDEDVIAGQGTIGLEILEQLPDVDAIICPVGGGGLIAGLAMAVKELKPNVKIYGVEAAACPSMSQSILEKNPTTVESMGTMADGIAVKRPGELTFSLVQKYVDEVICVDEMEISRTMLMLLERNKLLVEGSGASGLAALLYHKLPLAGKKVAVVISGGNVDMNFMSRIIQRGMVESGRFMQLSLPLKDRPGQLEKVLKIITDLEGNVWNLSQQHMGERIFPGEVLLNLSIETIDRDHIERILKRLKSNGYEVSTHP